MPLRLSLILFFTATFVSAQSPTIPDTPAGHTLQAWLDAFNSGDRVRIQSYLAKYDPTRSVDETVGFREQTGGFELRGVDKSERLHIEFRVKERASPTVGVGRMDVKDVEPAEIVHFSVRALPPGV